VPPSSAASKTNEGSTALKLVKHFIANPQPHQQPPHEPVAQPVILPVAPASPPQSNVVTVTSEAPEPVSPTISKAIEEFFAES